MTDKPKRSDELTDREREILKPYLSDVDANVFALENLNPEVIGGALARYSRAPTGFKETVAREFLNPDGSPNDVKGSQMIDRVVNKFGDESVAELAVAPLCMEEISNLMTKVIEDCRIGGSPIEESTRYVLYDVKKNGRWRYVCPDNIKESGLGKAFVANMDFIFETYAAMVEPMQDLFRKRLTEDAFKIEVERDGKIQKAGRNSLEDENEIKAHRIAYNFTIRSAACDVIRCILPACTQANVGLVGNGRFYSGLITKLLSHDLVEAHDLAESIRKALNTQIPTFIKRAGRNVYMADNHHAMRKLCQELFASVPIESVAEVELLEDRPEDQWVNLLSNMIFSYVRHSSSQIRGIVQALPEERKKQILETYIGSRQSKRDRPGRALEYGYPIQFDILAGFAEYRDLQRHRMLTQQRQDLGIDLGYSVPEEIDEIGMGPKVQECFERTESLHRDLKRAGMKQEAQYATLFNHFIRWNVGMNLRELGHLVELRTQKAGHPKYRRTAQMMARHYLKRHPEMEPVLQYVDYNDYDGGITRADQEARTARKSLASNLFDDQDC
ncbi:MAG: FAD-dependent thymidylate synthase [Nitrospinae bacterium]|nr:FAD-dependent thymidylate synthase [Nitrospinota bacterium]MBL7021139.1 FAD-dependent thymidylate synthase [Nitrospinaceae bacterium]